VTDANPNIASTLFVLPPDAKFLPVSELSSRLRAEIGPIENGHSVITRPGFRVTTRLIPGPLAGLLSEFRTPSLLTDAVLRFARDHGQDPLAMLDLAFDALASLVEARILVPNLSPDAKAPVPSLGAGQEFAGFEIDALVRSLEDSEVYRARRARGASGTFAALKISRDDRPAILAMLRNEARVLEHLGGIDAPNLLEHGTERGRTYVAMEWCDGVSITVAAQQARAARDRRRLHALVSRMLQAYGRLHKQGILHGDIHPGNCLVLDDGTIVILDFGNARAIDTAGAAVDLAPAGIPQFYDPLIANALLEGQLPPAATAESEQYAITVLVYLLLTGLHPIEAPAVQDEMLRRIVDRKPLPFATRGIASWPEVEAVVVRGLAKQPSQRFRDVACLARAFASASIPPDVPLHWAGAAQCAFDSAVEAVRSLLPPTAEFPLDYAWFGLRAALAMDDAELLAAADAIATWAGPGWAAQSVAAHLARARSDSPMESKAIAGFLAAAGMLPDGPQAAMAIWAAVSILEGTTFRTANSAALAGWAAERLGRLAHANSSNESHPFVAERLLVYLELSLGKMGAVSMRPDLQARLQAMRETHAPDAWLWSLAYDVFADDQFRALALAAKLPSRPLWRGFSLLRRHQLTGDARWVVSANRILARAPYARLPERDIALLMAELKAPERAILPPFLLPPAPTAPGVAQFVVPGLVPQG
jgi:hypothetical protein